MQMLLARRPAIDLESIVNAVLRRPFASAAMIAAFGLAIGMAPAAFAEPLQVCTGFYSPR